MWISVIELKTRMKKRPILMLMDWEQQTIVSMYFCVKISEEESFFILRRIIDISMKELPLKFNLKDSYSSVLVLVIDSGSQNDCHTWFVMVLLFYMFLLLLLGGFQRKRTWKWNKRWDFVDWQVVSHCSSNERKFHIHWSHLNIFLGIIEHITQNYIQTGVYDS